MPLEFALRRRINLEPPVPQRRMRSLRLPPLALPIVAYWLAIAVVTHTLRRSAAGDSTADNAQVAALPHDSEVADMPVSVVLEAPSASSPTAALNAGMGSPSQREFEAQPPPQVPEKDAHALESGLREPPSSAHRVLMSGEAPPRRVVEAAPRTRERPTPSAPTKESTGSRPETKTLALNQERARNDQEGAGNDRAPARDEATARSLPSCESAAAAANETIDIGSTRGAPDLTRDAFAAVLESGGYLARCAVPARTALQICAAVQDGKVIGVSVTTLPRSPAINACVRSAVATLRFPRNSRLDVTNTRFEPSL